MTATQRSGGEGVSAPVSFRHVGKRFGGVTAVDDLSLEVANGEMLVLLGPSGCGKTTSLRMLAGLESITSGEIRIGERVVNHLPPRSRDIAMVFQSYALYSHLSVYENLAYPLRVRKLPKAEIDRRVREVADVVQIGELLERKPRALSGGQRQRVALGRAIIRRPSVFLMDEPLSNLDAKLRLHTRGELKRFQRELATTTIYVTHDQVEAMTMANRIVVMRDGAVQQVGPAAEIYQHPANVFVATFVGSPPMNLLGGTLRSDGGALRVEGPIGVDLAGPVAAGDGTVSVGIRPENIVVDTPDAPGAIPGRIDLIEAVGSDSFLSVGLADGSAVIARVPADTAVREGQRVGLRFPAAAIRLFDGDGNRITTKGLDA